MIPIKPEIDEMLGWKHVVYAENQREYIPLPVLKELGPQGHLISCWKLSWREKFKLLFGNKIWLTLMTFQQPLQPIRISTDKPQFS